MKRPRGYLAEPAAPNGRGGVLVVHAWWGLNETMRDFCTRLAKEGYLAFAPDLYRGDCAASIEDAERLRDKLDDKQAHADVVAAASYLGDRIGSGATLAVIGFSLGAYFSLDLSVTHPDSVRAVVVFYGTGPGDYHQSKATYLGHFAEADEFEPASEVDRLEETLREAGRPVTFYRYPRTGHWFFERDREDAYDAEAAELAWRRTLAFLEDASP